MEPEIKVYIKKNSIYKHEGRYTTYIADNPNFLDKDSIYYEYTLQLPDSEITRIEKMDSVEPTEIETPKD